MRSLLIVFLLFTILALVSCAPSPSRPRLNVRRNNRVELATQLADEFVDHWSKGKNIRETRLAKEFAVKSSNKRAADPTTPIPWKNCGTAGDILKITSLTANTWPPQKGVANTLCVALESSQEIQDLSASVTGSWNSLPVINKQFNFNLPVGLPPFSSSFCKDFTVPAWISGDIALQLELKTSTAQEVICMAFEVSL